MFRRKNFRGAATCECPNILGALLYIEKKQLILFYNSKLFDYSKIKLIEFTFNVMLTYYTLILQYNFLVKL